MPLLHLKFSDRPFKSYIILKIHIHNINKILSFAPTTEDGGRPQNIWKKPMASRISL
jgi:hypothetical protein